MIGVYFSGTGNTKHCVEKFIQGYDPAGETFSIEEENAVQKICVHREMIIGYPVQFSNIPKILLDFIVDHPNIWNNKRIFIIATMGLFSGDGAGVLARLLTKHGATIIGGLHLKMPDSIGDEKALNAPCAIDASIFAPHKQLPCWEKEFTSSAILKSTYDAKQRLGECIPLY